MKNLWIFDFDGTLVDSEKTIKACYLSVAKELIPERVNYIESMIIGPTLDETVKLILTNKKIHLKEKFIQKFQMIYDNEFIYKTEKYEGVDQTLYKLIENNDHLALATNKRSTPTYNLINFFNWNILFEWIVCIDEYPIAKNKSDLIKIKLLNKNLYKKIFMVGDTMNDANAASDNDINFILAEYGYGSNEDWSKAKIFKKINKINNLI